MNTKAPLLSIKDITHNYQEGDKVRHVLKNLNLQVSRSESVALLGQSGSGKSTLLNLISGIDYPASGDISIDGISLTGLNEKERTLFRRKNIGFVYQFFNLIPTLTVEENLLLPLELNGIKGREAIEKGLVLLGRVGLEDRRGSFPDRLSGGEQQRLAIARALVHDPLLVLADEPTGNLDSERGKLILGLLDELVRASGKTMIIVTHSREVASTADRIVTMKDGAISHDKREGD
ncbi:MAG: ABC transporter ATP-binding protein [Deltaproteobacteria bacterium]|nr:ABC transporter ATP-binding protein [Deltaproteobacteria bacterium]